MNNMYCAYENKTYRVKARNKKIVIISRSKQEGYDKYIDVLGEEHDDLYAKEVDFNEVAVVYKEFIEIRFR